MTLSLQPVRVGTGFDEDGLLVFTKDQRLVAVLTHLSDEYDGASGQWYLEAGFGPLETRSPPTFANLDEAQDWIAMRLKERG